MGQTPVTTISAMPPADELIGNERIECEQDNKPDNVHFTPDMLAAFLGKKPTVLPWTPQLTQSTGQPVAFDPAQTFDGGSGDGVALSNNNQTMNTVNTGQGAFAIANIPDLLPLTDKPGIYFKLNDSDIESKANNTYIFTSSGFCTGDGDFSTAQPSPPSFNIIASIRLNKDASGVVTKQLKAIGDAFGGSFGQTFDTDIVVNANTEFCLAYDDDASTNGTAYFYSSETPNTPIASLDLPNAHAAIAKFISGIDETVSGNTGITIINTPVVEHSGVRNVSGAGIVFDQSSYPTNRAGRVFEISGLQAPITIEGKVYKNKDTVWFDLAGDFKGLALADWLTMLTQEIDSRDYISNTAAQSQFAPKLKHNYSATQPPQSHHNANEGYGEGSTWFYANEIWKLFNAQTGDWKKTTLTIDELGGMATQSQYDYVQVSTYVAQLATKVDKNANKDLLEKFNIQAINAAAGRGRFGHIVQEVESTTRLLKNNNIDLPGTTFLCKGTSPKIRPTLSPTSDNVKTGTFFYVDAEAETQLLSRNTGTVALTIPAGYCVEVYLKETGLFPNVDQIFIVKRAWIKEAGIKPVISLSSQALPKNAADYSFGNGATEFDSSLEVVRVSGVASLTYDGFLPPNTSKSYYFVSDYNASYSAQNITLNFDAATFPSVRNRWGKIITSASAPVIHVTVVTNSIGYIKLYVDEIGALSEQERYAKTISAYLGNAVLAGIFASPAGSDMSINLAGGTVISRFLEAPPNNFAKSFGNQSPLNFIYAYRSASGGTTFTASTTQLISTQYDDGSGTLAAVATSEFKLDRLYYRISDGAFVIFHGQKAYANKDDARFDHFTYSFVFGSDINLDDYVWLGSLMTRGSITNLTTGASFNNFCFIPKKLG